MGISLSNKDYIAFTIKKNERKKKGHDYDAIADYNKTIIKKRTEKERNKKKRKEKTKHSESAFLTRLPRPIVRKKKAGGERTFAYWMCTRCVR